MGIEHTVETVKGSICPQCSLLPPVPVYTDDTQTTCTFHPCIAPSDYGVLTNFRLGQFNNDVRQLSFNVSIVNDTIPENAEMFSVSLTLDPADQARRVTVSPDVATVTIQDNDGKAIITEPVLACDILSEMHLFYLLLQRLQ